MEEGSQPDLHIGVRLGLSIIDTFAVYFCDIIDSIFHSCREGRLTEVPLRRGTMFFCIKSHICIVASATALIWANQGIATTVAFERFSFYLLAFSPSGAAEAANR